MYSSSTLTFPSKPFKISRYTHVVNYNSNACFLYNAKSNAFAYVPTEVGAAIHSGESDYSFQQLLTHEGIRSKLIKGGFIVEQTRNEALDALSIIDEARKNNSWLGFTIAPTMNCNFACPYCFETKESVSSMDDTTAEKLISFLEKKLEGRTNLSVTWYGGEPTLAIERIEQLTKRIDHLVNAQGVALYCEIITNGYNLGRDIQDRLASCYISRYQITLDGPPHIHDLRRAPKNGNRSFWIILENIKKLMDRYQVDIRVNIDKNNLTHVDELIEILSKEGILNYCTLSFSHVDAITDASSHYNNRCLSLPVFAKESLDIYRRNINHLVSPLYPESPHTCAASGPNTYVVDPLGRLYRCWTAIGDQRECIGTIHDPKHIRYEDTLASFHIENDSACLECDILPICLGGCPYKFLALNGSPDRCIKWKFILHEMLNDYGQWWDANPIRRSS